MPKIPRKRRVELAAQDHLAAVEHLLPRFVREILGWDPDDCLITDESDLFDFIVADDDYDQEPVAYGGLELAGLVTDPAITHEDNRPALRNSPADLLDGQRPSTVLRPPPACFKRSQPRVILSGHGRND